VVIFLGSLLKKAGRAVGGALRNPLPRVILLGAVVGGSLAGISAAAGKRSQSRSGTGMKSPHDER